MKVFNWLLIAGFFLLFGYSALNYYRVSSAELEVIRDHDGPIYRIEFEPLIIRASIHREEPQEAE
jgi:hypothetical protein